MDNYWSKDQPPARPILSITTAKGPQGRKREQEREGGKIEWDGGDPRNAKTLGHLKSDSAVNVCWPMATDCLCFLFFVSWKKMSYFSQLFQSIIVLRISRVTNLHVRFCDNLQFIRTYNKSYEIGKVTSSFLLLQVMPGAQW